MGATMRAFPTTSMLTLALGIAGLAAVPFLGCEALVVVPNVPDACTPKTCAELPLACGDLDDGCGGKVSCGCGLALSCQAETQRCACASPDWNHSVIDSGSVFVGMHTAIATDATGAVHIAYSEGDVDLKYLRQPGGLPSWAATAEVVDPNGPIDGASLVVDAAGVVHLSYYRWKNAGGNFWDGELWYARREPSGTWTNRQVVAVGETGYVSGDTTALAIDGQGRLHILFHQFTALTADFSHAWSASGTSWQTELVRKGDRADSWTAGAGKVSLAVEGAKLHALFFDYIAQSLRYASCAADGKWTVASEPVALPSGTTKLFGDFSSLVIDSGGTLHAVFNDFMSTSNSALRYAQKRPGLPWTLQYVDPPPGTMGRAVGDYNSLAIDSRGRLHASYYDLMNQQLVYAYRPQQGAWTVEIADRQNKAGAYSAIAVDSANRVHISYFEEIDSRRGQLRYAVRCQ